MMIPHSKGNGRFSLAMGNCQQKIRRNVVHGKEEAQLVLEDWFDNKKETGQESTQTGTAEVEDMAIPKKKSFTHHRFMNNPILKNSPAARRTSMATCWRTSPLVRLLKSPWRPRPQLSSQRKRRSKWPQRGSCKSACRPDPFHTAYTRGSMDKQ